MIPPVLETAEATVAVITHDPLLVATAYPCAWRAVAPSTEVGFCNKVNGPVHVELADDRATVVLAHTTSNAIMSPVLTLDPKVQVIVSPDIPAELSQNTCLRLGGGTVVGNGGLPPGYIWAGALNALPKIRRNRISHFILCNPS
jgi:hypothetical protein